MLKKKVLNKSFLTQINKIAHSKKVFAQLKNFNKDYSNFDTFIDDFENFLVEKIELLPLLPTPADVGAAPPAPIVTV